MHLERVSRLKYLDHSATDGLKVHVDIEREQRPLEVICNIFIVYESCSEQAEITPFKAYSGQFS